MYYDLHIHSALSPCAENEMTPNNICNMALIKGLELIAVTDHNSVRQLSAFASCAKASGIKCLYGAELQTSEEVHVLALFKNLDDALKLQPWIDERMPGIPNSVDFFGDQWVCNTEDEFVEQEERLLLVSLSSTLDETIEEIHKLGGRAILAHVLDRENSIMNQLGFIPEGLAYDGLEVKSLEEIPRVLKSNPWIKEDETVWLTDSDAHRLIDIAEADHYMTSTTFKRLWGDEA
ncbi:MAG: PHP domain-containing protein [Firmicutes bacterium]|nr:PHP domain-containing protein [Bacillota bacterium]